jgi:hypothetical protein
MPKRIQMSRQKPWRAENPAAVIVARPSKWGNPFKVGGFYVNRGPWADAPYPEVGPAREREARTGFLHIPYAEIVAKVRDRAHAVELFRAHISFEDIGWEPRLIRAALAGKDLACWCPLVDSEGNRVPCHADVLLELANREDS